MTLHGLIPLPEGPVQIEVRVTGATQQFDVGRPGDALQPVGQVLDVSLISDEGGRGAHASCTGAFVGMRAHDLTGQGWVVDFTGFSYVPG